jgi:very-short-patch-repair endonuclease
VGRVDLLYEAEGVVIEALGHTFHRSREALARDARRVNELQLAGYRVLQFSFDQVTCDPRSIPRTVRAALAAPGRRAA